MCESLNKQIFATAKDVFNDKMLSTLWLNTPNTLFECTTPIYFCNRGGVGVLRVLTLIDSVYSESANRNCSSKSPKLFMCLFLF